MCERNINQLPLPHPQLGTWPAAQACALTGNQTGDLLVHRPVLNPLSRTRQGSRLTLFSGKSLGLKTVAVKVWTAGTYEW